jgi:hypothetical protein
VLGQIDQRRVNRHALPAGTAHDRNHNGILDECECQADLDGSGIVDLADLGLLLADWGCTGVYCVGDIDRNEETDLADLGMMLTQFGCSQ